MQSPKLRAFHRMYWVFFLIKQQLYQMTYLKYNSNVRRTTWPPGEWLPPNSQIYFHSELHSCRCTPVSDGCRKHRLNEFNHERSSAWVYLEQIECFVGPPGHQATGCHRIVRYIFITHQIHADVLLYQLDVGSIGSMNSTMKGLPNECT